MSRLYIVGGGMGGEAHLTVEARQALSGAGRIFAPPRLAGALRGLNPGIEAAGCTEILAALEQDEGDAVVAVSGDTGFYSLASTLVRKLSPQYDIHLIPGLSTLQVLCAKVGTGYEDVLAISTHGRRTPVLGAVSYHPRVFLLTGGGNDAGHILREIAEAGLEDVLVTAGINLGAPDEKVLTGTAEELAAEPLEGLVSLLVENKRAAKPFARLRDEDFARGKVPMTKEAVRQIALCKLEVAPADVVWDVGAGTGAMTITLARAAHQSNVWAVERRPEAVELIRENIRRLGSHNVILSQGEAPDALRELPPPDKVFVGGSSGKLEEIADTATAKTGTLRLCVTAITLESTHKALMCMRDRGFQDIEVDTLNVASAQQVGGYHMMKSHNPVTLLSGRWVR